MELGGIPVVTALSIVSGLPAVFVRKTAKAYGTAKLAEGPPVDGRNVLVVEDVVTTGGQLIESTNDLRDQGAVITTAVCVIDREQGGIEALAAAHITLRYVFTRSDIERSRDHSVIPAGASFGRPERLSRSTERIHS